jgi:hypothetical protein
MTSVDAVRRAEAYPRALRAGRLYFGGFAWGLVVLVTVSVADLSVWFLLPVLVSVPLVWSGLVIARDAWARLERELPELPGTEIRSASVIASAQDLLRRR